MYQDMLAAAMDPVASTIEWALSELIRHPRTMKKLQNELETVVGLDRFVEESDLENLGYLEMVIKEILRLRPIAPLLAPHASIEDCKINEFHIPKDSIVVFNVYAIGRDPDVWDKAEEFYPERFAESSIDYRGRDFELIPFGSGRRVCAGMQLGLTEIRMVLAQLVHCFDLELPEGMSPGELDMTEEFAQVIFRANPLSVVPTYRLNI